MKERLKEYGFYDFQINELMKKGKVETGHGTYKLDKKSRILKLNGEKVNF